MDSIKTILNAHVTLLRSDSIIAQSINTEHGFSLGNVPDGNYILNISHVGYQTKQMSLDVKRDLDMGNIPLTFAYELNDIIIESYRNITSYRNNLLHVNVKQTYLSELPNIESLLSNIPGVLQLNNQFTYFGKGQILFLINGREVKNMEEVNILHPSQIIEIVVNNMPGAKYESNYSSIIDIKTTEEKPALMVYSTNTWARHYSNISAFTTQRKVKNTLIDFGGGLRKRQNTLFSKQIEESFQPNNAFEQTFIDSFFSDRMSYDWQIGTQSKLNIGTLNLKYSGYHSTNKPIYKSLMNRISSTGEEDVDILRVSKYKEIQHLATINYLAEFKQKSTLRITADYLKQYRTDNTHATENTEIYKKQTNINFQSKYDIYSFLARYEHKLNNVAILAIGTRYSNVNNKNYSKKDEFPIRYHLQEERYAFYVEGTFQWEKLITQLGLRCENFNKRYDCTTHDVTDYKERFLLPSFTTTYHLSENLQVSLRGNNKVFLPSFNELSPITTYLNQYSYIIGNPLLKPTVRYDFGIGVVWLNKLHINFEYDLVKNDRITYSIPDEDDIRVLKSTFTNIDEAKQFTGMLTYSENLFKRHSVNLSTGILIPDVTIPYMGGYLHQTIPAYFTQIHYNWKIGKITNFTINYVYQSKSYDKADIYSAIHNLGCNISIVPIKNKLSLNIQANDILKKATSNWETNYGYIHTQQNNNADSRNIIFSIRYTYNSFKSVRKGNSNSEEIDRL